MSTHAEQTHQYAVSIHQTDGNGTLVFTFVPKGVQGTQRKRVPQFSAGVRPAAEGLEIDWSGTPDDPGPARADIEAEIVTRMKMRAAWIERVTTLVDQVEQWARELGWATRRIDKRLDDTQIGNHRVPALLMQEEIWRFMLEPIGRSGAGTEGLVDLYLMPAYDDIAGIYYYDGRWNVHERTDAGLPVTKAQAAPLSKEALEKLLAEMKRHAA